MGVGVSRGVNDAIRRRVIVREAVKHLYMVGTRVRVTFFTSVIKVSGINGKLSLIMVIGRLGNGSEFVQIERHDPMSRIT